MANTQKGRFVTGSTMRHVIVMTATSSLGLMAVFLVDALNLLYISMLGQKQLAAAIGYAGTLTFFIMSVAIGLTIATTAQVSRALGKGDQREAAELGGAGLFLMGVTMIAISTFALIYLRPMTGALGATGETLEIALRFMHFTIPSMVFMALGMAAAAILRAKGDAKRSMYVTLVAAIVTAVLDPIFIFVFDLGIDGAAIVTVISRLVLLGIGMHGVLVIHHLARVPTFAMLSLVAKPYFAIGLPAVMTQLATPVGNAWVTREIAQFGDATVAGWAILGRITPVAFGTIFALSGAVGPIIGQNFGAKRPDRIKSTMRDSFTVVIVYTLAVWALLALFSGSIATLFGAQGETRDIIIFFCVFVAGSFLFNGLLFVANAAFNNLGFPLYSTIANWGRSTLGVIPFVSLGAAWYGPEGALAGSGLGAIVFGLGAAWVCLRVVDLLDLKTQGEHLPDAPPAAESPFSSEKAVTVGIAEE